MLEAHPEQLSSFPTLRSGRYIISGVLGKGGNARVYQAWDTTLRAWRAIKVLSPEFITNDEVRARFAQEAATMARLDHPNLVKVYDISDDPFTPHIVMELCEGGAIIGWMKEHGAVPPKLALRVIGEIALAVQSAHEEGIIHRDIKPQNILIDQYGIAKLTDFGIARDTDNSLTKAGATMGTYAFMAPEQRHDSTSVDVRTDIYSLGATLFTLTRVKTTTELFIAEADDPLFEPLPDPLVEFILRTCSYRPRDRFQTIDDFLVGLKTLSAALPDDPERTPPIQALARPLPVRPPDDLPDLEQLEDLLKALALNDHHAHTTGGTSIEQTTLGGSTAPFAVLRDRQLPPPQPVSPQPSPAPAPQPEETLSPLPSQPFPASSFSISMSTGLMLAGGVASVIAALLSALLIYGVVAVGGAASDVRRAEHDLVTTVIASSSILQSLEEGQQLKSLYIKVQDGSPHASARDARLYANALDHALLIAAPKGDAIHLAQNVLNANERVESSEQRWRRAASSPAGLFATALGLAEAP